MNICAFTSYVKSIGLIATIDYAIQRYVVRKDMIAIKIPQAKHKILLRRNSTDVNVFNQIFVRQEFLFLKSHDFKVIVDCGANIGLTTIYLKYLFPDARIFSIEPENENFKLLRQNTLPYSQLVLINKALSNDSNGLYLIDDGNGSDAFQTKKASGDSAPGVKIESISMLDLMKQYDLPGLDFAKIDIEGAEAYCITDDAMKWISLTGTLAIEIHDSIVPGTTAKIKKLLSNGFEYSQQGEYSVFKNITYKKSPI